MRRCARNAHPRPEVIVDPKAFKQRFPSMTTGLSGADVQSLIDALHARPLVQGDVLVEQGAASDRLWLVFEGTLGVTVSVAGRSVSLGRVGQGATVGEVSFLDGGPASATLKAQGPGLVLELTSSAAQRLLAEHPRAAAAINRAACEAIGVHLHAATDKLQALRAGQPGQTRPDADEESLLDALRELLGLGRS